MISSSPTPSERSPVSSRTMSQGGPELVMAENSSDVQEDGRASYSSSPAMDQPAKNEDIRATRRGRRGHTKSRTGCFNCKKARIKCKENRPSCEYCSHRDLKCEWPDLQINQVNQIGTVIRKATPSPIPTPIQTQGPVFTMLDFRLFNHFIQTAYPHHPPRDDSVWTHEIPSIASDYDFLLHSMLALSASDIAASSHYFTTPDLECIAMSHRVKAISSLNNAIGQPLSSIAQGNAMIATCFSLLFQSTLIADGLIEYMTFLRGILLVSIQMGQKNLKFVFENLFNQSQVIESELEEARLIDPELARGACRSLELLCPLVQNKREVEFYGHLLAAARALFTSSQSAFSNLAKIYSLFSYEMSHAEFAAFIDPSHEAGKLLQSHFCALQLIMTPITRRESIGRKNSTTPGSIDGKTAGWLSTQHRDINPEMRAFYEWPVWVQQQVLEGKLCLKWDVNPTNEQIT